MQKYYKESKILKFTDRGGGGGGLIEEENKHFKNKSQYDSNKA